MGRPVVYGMCLLLSWLVVCCFPCRLLLLCLAVCCCLLFWCVHVLNKGTQSESSELQNVLALILQG